MVTYIVRHAQTTYSAVHRLNGDPAVPVPLDDAGRAQCRTVQLPVDEIVSFVTSPFPRAMETLELLAPGRPAKVEPRLRESDFGKFEGHPFVAYGRWLYRHGPTHRSAGSTESQYEAMDRMLAGFAAVLDLPGPRLVVTHGLPLALLVWARDHPGVAPPLFLPAPGYVTAIQLSDEELGTLTSSLRAAIQADATRDYTPGDLPDFLAESD